MSGGDRVRRILDEVGLPDGLPLSQWRPEQIETLLQLLWEVKLHAWKFRELLGEDRQQWEENLHRCDLLIKRGREAMRRVRS
jgi:hypothetical protein